MFLLMMPLDVISLKAQLGRKVFHLLRVRSSALHLNVTNVYGHLKHASVDSEALLHPGRC